MSAPSFDSSSPLASEVNMRFTAGEALNISYSNEELGIASQVIVDVALLMNVEKSAAVSSAFSLAFLAGSNMACRCQILRCCFSDSASFLNSGLPLSPINE